MRRHLLLCALVGLSAPAFQVLAQPPVRSADPEAAISEEFVVHGRLPGPAWWTVSKGESKVYILGIPGSLPKGMAWNTSVLERRLQGANALIGRPMVTANLGDLFSLAKLHTNTPMEASLSPALRTRLAETEARVGLDPGHYRHWIAIVAGLQLVLDYRAQQKLATAEPGASVEKMARHEGLKVTPAGVYKAGALMKAIAPPMGAVGDVCIADALDEIDAGADGPRAAAIGWANGDPQAALAEGRGYEKCVNALPEGADLARRAMEDTASAITAALAKPGHSVAVVNLRTLLARDGVLQQLRARGYTIRTPQDD
jgi:uncharacterized protein YbaP (TraB family)